MSSGAAKKLVETVARLGHEPNPPFGPGELPQVGALAGRLAELERRVFAWRTRYDAIWPDVHEQKTLGRARNLVTGLREAAGKIDGQQRLEEAKRLKLWRASSGDDAARLARAILEDVDRKRNAVAGDVARDLAEIESLVELLGAEERPDNLPNLKDNKLTPALERFSRDVAEFSESHPDTGNLMAQLTGRLTETLFGQGYVNDREHQTMRVGTGGLYSLRRDILRLDGEREKLGEERQALAHQIDEVVEKIMLATRAQAEALTDQVEVKLTAGLRRMMIAGIGSCVLFVGLAWLISIAIRHQIGVIERAKAEAEEGRQTALLLMEERKRAEASIRLQSAALNAATNSVVITDARGNIEWVNPAFCRISGYEQAEVLGKNPRILQSGRQSPEYYAQLWGTILRGQSWQGEFVNRHKNGGLYTEEVTITPVQDGYGVIRHFVAIKQDVSALKQSIGDLNRAHVELEDKNRELEAALVDAHAAVEAKSAFLATMSHEIRTPLNGVVGMASILRETAPLTAEQRDCVETIRASGDTLLVLINDILDFSKIESGHLELERTPFDLRRCVEETLESLAPRAREKQLELAAEIDDSVPAAIVGDAVRLRQVLTNLVGNAVKFTSRGEVVIEVRAEPAPAGRHRLLFRVRDTGIGIPVDKLNRLFKAFSQIDVSTTRLYGGTGLGLAISQRLVGFMGGEIGVSSQLGAGSVFFFDITVEAAPAIESIDVARLHAGLAGRRVLVVDDNATNRRIFVNHLRRAGLIPFEAVSGAEGLEWLDAHDWPDLIITDMVMPGMDGLDFTLAVRAKEASSRPEGVCVPVMMVSSGGYRANDARLAAARLISALSKPLRQQQLIDAVALACAILPPPAVASGHSDRTRGGRLSFANRYPRRILVVEDNAVNRKVIIHMLTRLGYVADVVVNGLLAIEACRAKTYDVVLMDVQMPELDGLEATRRIRRSVKPPLTIIAMTANAMSGDREACIAAGMDGYVSKPLKLDDLENAIMASARQNLSIGKG
ncbi:MAG: response regulator [Opitutaceae bacterium]|jgi:PAS domain S-box-containing protein